jgi:hypothetical protein
LDHSSIMFYLTYAQDQTSQTVGQNQAALHMATFGTGQGLLGAVYRLP